MEKVFGVFFLELVFGVSTVSIVTNLTTFTTFTYVTTWSTVTSVTIITVKCTFFTLEEILNQVYYPQLRIQTFQYGIFNRLGVSRAVLQTLSSLIH